MGYLERHKDFYVKYLRSSFGEPVGASECDIRKLESQLEIEFPQAYREYLLWMGNDQQGVLKGSDWFLNDILENTENLPELLELNGVEPPSDDFLAFFSHQGYMAAWFLCRDKQNDPVSYFFSESSDDPAPRKYDSFSDFLFAELKYQASIVNAT